MEYTKIRLDFKYGPKNRFYRVILVKGDPDLFKLSCAFCTILGATFEHCFLISCEKEDVNYVMASFLEDSIGNYKYLGRHSLRELPEKFVFTYDTGDGWDFDCKIYKKSVEIKSTKEFILLDGHGLGIWEDNIRSLWAYFDGEVDPESDDIDEEKGFSLPWNLDMEKYSDFDKPLDIEKISKSLTRNIHQDYYDMSESEREYIEENKIDIDNAEDYFAEDDDIDIQILKIINKGKKIPSLIDLKIMYKGTTEKELKENEKAKQLYEDLKVLIGEKEAFDDISSLVGLTYLQGGNKFDRERFNSILDDMVDCINKKAKQL